MSTIILPDVDYPTGDGKPMAETPVHRVNMTDSIAMLEDWYKERRDVYISGNMLMYYEEGNPLRHVSPDVFVVLGIPQRDRDCYKTWEEPKSTLDLVIEFTSKSTRREDQKSKHELYRTVLGVREYCLFDPYAEYLRPSMQLYRLTDGEYVRVEAIEGRLPSQVLDLHIDRNGRFLRLWNPVTGLWLPTREETAQRERQTAERERQTAERERQSAIEAGRRAEQAQQRADAERTRADEAQAVIARLQAELEKLKGAKGD